MVLKDSRGQKPAQFLRNRDWVSVAATDETRKSDHALGVLETRRRGLNEQISNAGAELARLGGETKTEESKRKSGYENGQVISNIRWRLSRVAVKSFGDVENFYRLDEKILPDLRGDKPDFALLFNFEASEMDRLLTFDMGPLSPRLDHDVLQNKLVEAAEAQGFSLQPQEKQSPKSRNILDDRVVLFLDEQRNLDIRIKIHFDSGEDSGWR